MIEIYTDGAYSSLRNQGGWAFLVLNNDSKIFSAYDYVKETTNNRMEIQSVIEAIKHMNNEHIKEFTIYSDSMYVIGTMTLNWKRKKNIDLWVELDNIIQPDTKIEWEHVKGHSGEKWNDHCDMLAVHASQIN
jgi:ribonuclease HI